MTSLLHCITFGADITAWPGAHSVNVIMHVQRAKDVGGDLCCLWSFECPDQGGTRCELSSNLSILKHLLARNVEQGLTASTVARHNFLSGGFHEYC